MPPDTTAVTFAYGGLATERSEADAALAAGAPAPRQIAFDGLGVYSSGAEWTGGGTALTLTRTFTTDGVWEARAPDGSFFGAERMLEVVRASRDRPPSEIIQSLQQAVFDFTKLKKPQDDVTAVVIKVSARAGT